MTSLLGLCLAVSAYAQKPPRARIARADYFPLAVGNQWVYAQRGAAPGEPVRVEIVGSAEHGGQVYFELAGFFPGRGVQVRQTESGDVVERATDAGADRLWYSFRSLAWMPQLPCVGRAAAQAAAVPLPDGSRRSGLVVRYTPGLCADAGLVEEIFAAGVGLVRRVETTIAGPREWNLVFASINGTFIAGPEVSFSLAIDRPVYFADFMPPVDPARAVPALQARLTIRNTSALPLSLVFNSGQQYDLAIRDESGRQVFLWSEGKFFTLALTRLDLSPGEKTFLIEVRLADRTTKTFPEGRYTAEAWLTTTGGKLYSATVPFEIRYTF